MKRNNRFATNRRVVDLVSWCFCPEPTGSGFGLFVYGWNHSDSAAHAKHQSLRYTNYYFFLLAYFPHYAGY